MDITNLVKEDLNKKGMQVDHFKENIPGLEWFYNFDSRNIILNEKFAQHIKRSRAFLTKEVIIKD